MDKHPADNKKSRVPILDTLHNIQQIQGATCDTPSMTNPLDIEEAVTQGRKLKERGAPKGNQNALDTDVKIKGDNITFDFNESNNPPRGTSKSYLTARLERDHQDLFNKVASGELTAHMAAFSHGIKTYH